MRYLLLALVLTGCVSKKDMVRAQSKYDLGVAYYREGNTESAITTLRESVAQDPRNWRARNALAIAYIARGENTLAEESFAVAMQLNGEEAEILVNYGAFLVRIGRLEEGIEVFNRALKDLDYRNPSLILSNLSFAYLRAGKLTEAHDHAREAIRRTPTLCEAWFHLGLVEEARGDADAALAAYSELVRACPGESVGARLRTGCLQAKGPLPQLGEDTLREVVAEVPNTSLADEARDCLRSAGL